MTQIINDFIDKNGFDAPLTTAVLSAFVQSAEMN